MKKNSLWVCLFVCVRVKGQRNIILDRVKGQKNIVFSR
jgi:hypothetical protein